MLRTSGPLGVCGFCLVEDIPPVVTPCWFPCCGTNVTFPPERIFSYIAFSKFSLLMPFATKINCDIFCSPIREMDCIEHVHSLPCLPEQAQALPEQACRLGMEGS